MSSTHPVASAHAAPPLAELAVVVVDCQSTGASPQRGQLLEVGWTLATAGPTREPSAAPIVSRLVALPPGQTLPPAIARLTGLTDADLHSARPAPDVWSELVTAVAGRPVVIHFARFELAFLHAVHASLAPDRAFPLDVVCTHEIARRLLPDLPRRGLRALAGYVGHPCDELKRSAGHVAATVAVWRDLVARLQREHAITTLDGLRAWLGDAPVPRRRGRAYPMSRSRRLALPHGPGIYRLQDRGGRVLYVGKAVSLHRRVNGYFQKQTGVPDRLLELLTQVRDVTIEVTESGVEAALRECDEIKRLDPPYNRALRGRGRAVWVTDRAWTRVATAADARGRGLAHGPHGAGRLPRAGAAIVALLACPDPSSAVDPELVRLALGRTGRGAPPPAAVVHAGVRAFVEAARRDTGIVVRDAASLLRLGHARGPARGPDDPADDDDALDLEATDDVAPWTETTVAEQLRERIDALAHAIRRARWLRRLADATIVFREDLPRPRRRALTLRRGAIVAACDLPRGDPEATVLGPPTRARDFDLPTFDRLRVLGTELRRIVAADLDAAVYPTTGRPLSGDRLRRALAWT